MLALYSASSKNITGWKENLNQFFVKSKKLISSESIFKMKRTFSKLIYKAVQVLKEFKRSLKRASKKKQKIEKTMFLIVSYNL